MDWTTLANIGTVVETVLVTIGAIYGLVQLREILKSRHLQATIELLDILGSDDVAAARQAALEVSVPAGDLSEAEWKNIHKASLSFNRAGWLLTHGLVDKEMLFDMYCESIVGAWDKLEPYVEYAREAGRFPRWQRHFELLAEDARGYATRRGYL
jgi:hypothetical protein